MFWFFEKYFVTGFFLRSGLCHSYHRLLLEEKLAAKPTDEVVSLILSKLVFYAWSDYVKTPVVGKVQFFVF